MNPGPGQGFRAHYDDHVVIVLQIAGTKEWRFYDTPVDLPLASQGYDPDTGRDRRENRAFLLQPGDNALTCPRGPCP